ncbi:MAG: protein kinase [Planctomycetota bacterium]
MISIQCPTSDRLKSLSVGQLPEQESEELFEHVRSCTACRSEMEAMEQSKDSLLDTIRRAPATQYVEEPDCQVAMARALGALADSQVDADSQVEAETPDSPHRSSTGWTEELKRLPEQIAEYEILHPLGRGGMGSVLLARHTKLGRQVALKILASHRLANSKMRDRFEQEMRAIGQLSHENIVTAHDAREVDGTAVLVTEYIQGMDLGELVQRVGPLPLADACEVTRRIANALAYTSSQGFVHRDVKPSNIMLSETGEVKLLDLGLARLQFGEEADAEITGTGQAMGTADYVAPEQVADSRNVDIRSDIYSLGCTLFKLLTGNAPFADDRHLSAYAKMNAHVNSAAPSLNEVGGEYPEALNSLVARMLSKQPAERPQTPIELETALAPWTPKHDLIGLLEKAKQLEPQENSPRTSTFHAQTDGRKRSTVPTWIAVSIAVGMLILGFCLGVIIKIKFPDGTTQEIEVPKGSEITTLYTTDGNHENAAQQNKSAVGDGDSPNTRATSGGVVAFGIPILRSNLDPVSNKQAIDHLYSTDSAAIVPNLAARWFRLANKNVLPNDHDCLVAKQGDHEYVLLKYSDKTFLSWKQLKFNSRMEVSMRDGRRVVEMRFMNGLDKRVYELTKAHMNQPMVVILENEVVSAPTIRSPISANAVLEGNMSDATLQRVMKELVDPFQSDVEDPFAPLEADIRAPTIEGEDPLKATAGSVHKAGPRNNRVRNSQNPFGSDRARSSNVKELDPFGGDGSSERSNPFGDRNLQKDHSDPFGSSNDKDPFGGSSNNAPFGNSRDNDPFGGSTESSDPFGGDTSSSTGKLFDIETGAALNVAPIIASSLYEAMKLGKISNPGNFEASIARLFGRNVKSLSEDERRQVRVIAESLTSLKGISKPVLKNHSSYFPNSGKMQVLFVEVDWKEFLEQDVATLVSKLVKSETVFPSLIAGVRHDPNGPQVDVEQVLGNFHNQMFIAINKVQPEESSEWMVAIRLKDSGSVEKLVTAIEEENGPVRAVVHDEKLYLGDFKSISVIRSRKEDAERDLDASNSQVNLQKIGIAFHQFHEHYGRFPGTKMTNPDAAGMTGGNPKPYSWRVALLPFLGEEELYREYRFDEEWDSENNLTLLEKMPAVYHNPASSNENLSDGLTNYVGIAAKDSALGIGDGFSMAEFTDGTSPTLLVLETACEIDWTCPKDYPAEEFSGLGSMPFDSSGPVTALMADGAVRKIESDLKKLEALATRNGGEPVSQP